MKKISILFFLFLSLYSIGQENIYKNISAIQCDSLIKANKWNPGFVILDVRTPGEYNPQHLEGAINRNYYDPHFSTLLDSLNHDKIYLIHCKSGSRSRKAFAKMKEKNFKEVYNMKGGITAWKNASLPTTGIFAPRIMLVSDSIVPSKTIKSGTIDTIRVTITNRANDTLKFYSFHYADETEFSTDFDTSNVLQGAEDYSFEIFYEPVDEQTDSIDFIIESNGGIANIHIVRTGTGFSATIDKIRTQVKVFPNPASDYVRVENLSGINHLDIVNIQGQKIFSRDIFDNYIKINVSGWKKGIYFIKMTGKKYPVFRKISVD